MVLGISDYMTIYEFNHSPSTEVIYEKVVLLVYCYFKFVIYFDYDL